MRGRPKGGTNKYWSSQEKYETIKPVLKGEISGEDQARKIGFKSYLWLLNKGLNHFVKIC